MKKQILGLALVFALSTNLHAQTTDTTNKAITPESTTGSNGANANNGNNTTLDSTSVKTEITPATPDGMNKPESNSPKKKAHKAMATKPENGGTPPQK